MLADPRVLVDARHLTLTERVLLGFATLAVLLPGTFGVSLTDRDEGWYAQVSREMLASGDWLVPHYRGEPWIAKPPLLFWCVAAAFHAFGPQAWAGRLVSVAAMTGVVQLLGTLAAGLYNRRVAWIACVSFIAAVLPAVVGKLVLTDALLLVCCLGAMVMLWQVATHAATLRRAAAFWLFVGLAVLAKGPAVVVFVGAFALALCTLPEARRHLLSARLWRTAPVCLAVAAPWYILVALRAGSTFWQQFLGFEIAARLTGTPHGHGGPPGYYLIFSLAGWLPWTVLIPGAVVGAWRARRTERAAWLLLVWLGLPWLLLELIPSKLPHYILPCYVPLAIMLGRCWDLGCAGPMTRARNVTLGIWVALPILCGATVIVLAAAMWDATWSLPAGVIGAVLAAGFVGVGGLLVRGRRLAAWAGAAAVTGLIHILVGCWVLPGLEPQRLSRQIADATNELAGDGREVLISGYTEPTVFFYLHHPAHDVAPGELRSAWEDRRTPRVLVARDQELREAGIDPDEHIPRPRRVVGFNYVKGRMETIWVIPVGPPADLR